MKTEDIKPGLCYTNSKKKQQILVRKVISIIDGKVNYQFLTGVLLKHGIKNNSSSLKSFANWATSEIEELDDYSHLMGFAIQKNYIILNVAGEPFLKCQEKKVNFYLGKNLLKWINEDTLQFTTDEIEKKLFRVHKGKIPEYFMTDKNECCVVCGGTTYMTKHHVIPRKDLKYYPEEVKTNLSNLLAVCRKCHDEYERIKEGFEVSEYILESALKWMNHFIKSMQPKFLPQGWHVINECTRVID